MAPVLVAAFALFTSFAQQIPTITMPVTDAADVIPGDVEPLLTTHVERLRTETGVQLAILVVKNLPDQTSIEDYSMQVAEAWKGGSKDRDDGLLLTLAMNDRKSRLEVGYGLEPLLTDGEAGAILQGMREKLRMNDVGGALIDATLSVHREVSTLTPTSSRLVWRTLGIGLIGYRHLRLPIVMILVGGFALLFILSLRKKRPRARWLPKIVEKKGLPVVGWLLSGAAVLLVDSQIFELGEFLNTAAIVILSTVLFMSAASATNASTLKHASIAAAVMVGIVIPILLLFPFGAPALVSVLVGCTMFIPFTLGFAGRIEGGGDGGSSSSGSAYSSSSSSSSSSSDYSGGGGSFGGGGASSDW